MKTTAPFLTSKRKYYDVLDGLRGIAALTVMIFHYFEFMKYRVLDFLPIGHGFLAVDFFFCLSGFVVAFAYDGRMKTFGIGRFFRNRLIRLHPMIVIGTLLGAVVYVVNPSWESVEMAGWGKIIAAVVCAFFLIPFPWMPYREGELFPLNTPTWSLFFEYIANIAYALVLFRLKKGWLLAVGIASALGLVYCGWKSGILIHGWNINFLADGFARVAFSFTAGMIVYRFNWIIRNKAGILLPAVLLIGLLAAPHVNNDWIVECTIVILLFPLIISLGAGATIKGATRKVFLFLGRLSYPLYLTHITLVTLFASYYERYQPEGLKLAAILVSLIVCNLLLAYAVLRFYDEPVRRWLTTMEKTGRKPR